MKIVLAIALFFLSFAAHAEIRKEEDTYDSYVIYFEHSANTEFVITAEFPTCKGVIGIDGEVVKVGNHPLYIADVFVQSTFGICNPHQDPSKSAMQTFKSKVFSIKPNGDDEVRILVPSKMKLEAVP